MLCVVPVASCTSLAHFDCVCIFFSLSLFSSSSRGTRSGEVRVGSKWSKLHSFRSSMSLCPCLCRIRPLLLVAGVCVFFRSPGHLAMSVRPGDSISQEIESIVSLVNVTLSQAEGALLVLLVLLLPVQSFTTQEQTRREGERECLTHPVSKFYRFQGEAG